MAIHRRWVLGPLWIPLCAIILSSVGCARKVKTQLTEIEVWRDATTLAEDITTSLDANNIETVRKNNAAIMQTLKGVKK